MIVFGKINSEFFCQTNVSTDKVLRKTSVLIFVYHLDSNVITFEWYRVIALWNAVN